MSFGVNTVHQFGGSIFVTLGICAAGASRVNTGSSCEGGLEAAGANFIVETKNAKVQGATHRQSRIIGLNTIAPRAARKETGL
jgi:hypothetical protein